MSQIKMSLLFGGDINRACGESGTTIEFQKDFMRRWVFLKKLSMKQNESPAWRLN